MLGLDLPTLLARAITLLIAFTIHELAHAVSADALGDLTPRRMGRITLNPLRHLDPAGTIFLLLTGFGWAKPVMVNPYNMRGNPRTSMAIVAAAGPLSNLVMAILGAIPFRLGIVQPAFSVQLSLSAGFDMSSFLSFLLTEFVWINLILMFFNLIPIPPLDGYRILAGLLPVEMAATIRPLEQYGFLLLMGLIFLLPLLGFDVLTWLVAQPASMVMGFLFGF